MTTKMNCSVMAAAYSLGVDANALAAFVKFHNPLPGQKNENQESLHTVGDEMARIVDGLNPELAQRWRIVNYLTHRSQNVVSRKMS